MENIIKKAEQGGYDGVTIHYNTSKSRVTLFFYQFILDPLFWQALGKACGWAMTIFETNEIGSPMSKKYWMRYAMDFHEINLTQGFNKAVEWLEEKIK